MPFLIAAILLLILVLNGFGFAVYILNRQHNTNLLLVISLSFWFGLISIYVFDIFTYYATSKLTLKQIAFVQTAIFLPISAYLFTKFRPQRFTIKNSYLVPYFAAVTSFVINTKPMWSAGSLSYYYLNNGEYSNYSLLADSVKFNTSSFQPGGPWGVNSREAVTSIVISHFSSLFGTPTIWITQLMASIFLFISVLLFGIGLLIHFESKQVYGKSLFICLISLSYGINVTTQVFWTLSFFSQYVSIAVILGTFVVLKLLGSKKSTTNFKALVTSTITLLLLSAVYPEMFLVHFILIAGLTIFNGSQSRLVDMRKKLLLLPVWVFFLYLISPTKFTFHLSTPSSGGWNIFGSFDEPIQFVANLSGLANPFTPEHPFTSPLVWIVVFSIIPMAISLIKEKAVLHESSSFILAFFFTVAFAILIYIQYRSVQTNFMLMKFLIGFSWIPYFFASKWLISIAKFRWFAISCFLIIAIFQFNQTTIMSANYFNSSKAEIYFKSDADNFQKQFSKDQFCATSSFMGRYELFLLNNENIFTEANQWPTYSPSEFATNSSSSCSILIIGNKANYVELDSMLTGYTLKYSENGYEVFSKLD
jgi:hypothetical protein